MSRGPTCLHAVYRHSGDDEPIEHRAIFLGVLSYDGNLLIIEPGGPREPCPS